MQFSFSISVLSSQRTHAILKEANCFVDFERLGVLKGRGASDAARRGQLLGSRLFVTTKMEQNRSLSQATQFGSKTISGPGKQLIALARREKKEGKKELQPIREKKDFRLAPFLRDLGPRPCLNTEGVEQPARVTHLRMFLRAGTFRWSRTNREECTIDDSVCGIDFSIVLEM